MPSSILWFIEMDMFSKQYTISNFLSQMQQPVSNFIWSRISWPCFIVKQKPRNKYLHNVSLLGLHSSIPLPISHSKIFLCELILNQYEKMAYAWKNKHSIFKSWGRTLSLNHALHLESFTANKDWSNIVSDNLAFEPLLLFHLHQF